MKAVNKLKKITAKMHQLSVELESSMKYEKCQDHLVKSKDSSMGYYLVRIKDKTIACAGREGRITSYMNLRNINASDVFEFEKHIQK